MHLSLDTIAHGDCLEILKTIPSESINLIVTSPPYADNRKGGYGGVPVKKYVEWFLPISKELFRVLKPDGSFVLNIKERVVDGERGTYVYELVLKMTVHAYAIKSGPNPFNSSAKKRQHDEFMSLRNRLYKLHKKFDPVLAYSYGRKNTEGSDNTIYREVSGQKFWDELTGDPQFYLKIISLMKDIPQKKKVEYRRNWDATINRFEAEFIRDFCYEDGRINWEKLT